MPYSRRGMPKGKDKTTAEYDYFDEDEWDKYPFASEEDMEWFNAARYGLFLHVGISAIGGIDISWPRQTHKLPDPPYGSNAVPDDVYDGWAKQLKFNQFDAKQWAALAKQCGFRYVVIISKHHDGFHMWDTAQSDYKITNSPFGRDYLKELIEAFRAEGIKIGIYYSKRDWKHPDYEPVPTEDAYYIPIPPHFKMKEGKEHYITEKHKRYQEYMFATVRELLTNYGKIDLLWWDAEYHNGMFNTQMWRSEELVAMVKQLQPHIIINNRAALPGDFDTPEGHVGFFQNTRPWESCMPLGRAWAHSKGPIKSKKTLLSQLLNCVGGDGNYLLSIGCLPDGSIDKAEAERMRELGAWLDKYGKCVYGTRGGVWKPTKRYAATMIDDSVYLFIFKNFLKRKLVLPLANHILLNAECLSGERIITNTDNGKLSVKIASKSTACEPTIVKLLFKTKPKMEV